MTGKKHHSEENEKDENVPPTRFDQSFGTADAGEVSDDQLLPSPEDIKELHFQVDTLNKALAEAQEKANANWERLLRKEADMQNLQTRMQREIENTRKFAVTNFAQELVQVLDSIDQGLTYAQKEQATVKDLVEGMLLTQTVLMQVLEKHGIKPINPEVGEAFDPAFHEAISVQQTDEFEPNRIVMVVQKGYMLHERLLRPARAVVSAKA